MKSIATTPLIDQLLATDAPVAIGVSGGSAAGAAAVLDRYAELMAGRPAGQAVVQMGMTLC